MIRTSKRFFSALFFFIIITVTVTGIFSEDIEDALDKELLGTEANKLSSEEESAYKWKFFGFFENENFFDATGKASQKSNQVIKTEARAHLNVRYGSDFYFLSSKLDLFYYPEWNAENNKTLKNPHRKIEVSEMYISGGENLQVKLGKQIYKWGVADAFRVSNYLDQTDIREMFNPDEGDRDRGVFSFSAKYILSDFAFDIGIVPIHQPTLLPPKNSYWAFKLTPVNVAALGQSILPTISNGSSLPYEIKNASFATRFGGNIDFIDFHFSYFNGIDKDLLFRSETCIDPAGATNLCNGNQLEISAEPYYGHVQKGGFDIAFDIEKLTVRAESTFAPNKWAIIQSKDSDLLKAMQSGVAQKIKDKVEMAPFIAYSVGLDYLFWGEDGRVFLEWMQGQYLKNRDIYQKIFFTDLLMIRIEDKFINKHLETSIGSFIRLLVGKKAGYVLVYSVGWNFQNGLILSTGGNFIVSQDDKLLSPFEDNDYIYVKGKMEF